MLGAVIKFIYKDNAQKEIAKHSEIIEEYVEISEQMKQSNEDLTKALSEVAQAQSDSSKQTTEFLTKDLRTSSENNMKILKAVAENRDIMIAQMYEAIEMMAKTSMPNFTPQAQFERVAYQEPQRVKQIEANSKTDMINLILNNVSNVGDKILPKTQLIDVKKRSETKMYETAMKELTDLGVVDYKRGRGYFLSVDIDKAVGILSGDEPTTHQIGFKAEEPKTTEELLKNLDIQKVFAGIDNNGIIFAYLYKDYLIQNNRSAIITKPKKGCINRDLQMYNGMLYIETSKYNDNHEPLYEGKQTALYKLIEIVDSLSHNR
jgi:predicted RNA-binding protein